MKDQIIKKLLSLDFNDGKQLLFNSGFEILNVQCFNDLSNDNTEYFYCFSNGNEEIYYSINTSVNVKDIIWR